MPAPQEAPKPDDTLLERYFLNNQRRIGQLNITIEDTQDTEFYKADYHDAVSSFASALIDHARDKVTMDESIKAMEDMFTPSRPMGANLRVNNAATRLRYLKLSGAITCFNALLDGSPHLDPDHYRQILKHLHEIAVKEVCPPEDTTKDPKLKDLQRAFALEMLGTYKKLLLNPLAEIIPGNSQQARNQASDDVINYRGFSSDPRKTLILYKPF